MMSFPGGTPAGSRFYADLQNSIKPPFFRVWLERNRDLWALLCQTGRDAPSSDWTCSCQTGSIL